ncbi:MAG: Lrp/AsnC family transcriptional regulator [Gemmatimonadaceae bacterium]
MINEKDAVILAILQANGRASHAEIGRRLGMAPSAVFERVRKLEERGVIQGYSARLDPRALGLGTLAYIFVRGDEGLGAPRMAKALAQIPGVQEVHHIAGEDCFLVKVRAESTDELGHLLSERFGAIKSIRSTRTTIVLGTTLETADLPLATGSGVVRVVKVVKERGRG